MEDTPKRSPEDIALELAGELPSPFCPGRSIASCSSGAARVVEQEMVEMAKSGKSKAEIETILTQRFGTEVMGTPIRGDLVWAVSLAAIAAVLLLAYRARRWVHKPLAPEAEPTLSEAERDRLDEELDRLDV